MSLRIITTRDGSHSLLNENLNETYHSVHGAIQESEHVFITNGFLFAGSKLAEREVIILEVGFGTGLNAWLTLQSAEKENIIVKYTSLEAFPVEEVFWRKLNYAEGKHQHDFEKLHEAPWNEWSTVQPFFLIKKIRATLQEISLPRSAFDLVYFDAFAPNKQPELWELPMLQKVVEALKPGGVWVTYCAKGQLKRDLKSLGMNVETLPGPPGKREMVRATKIYNNLQA